MRRKAPVQFGKGRLEKDCLPETTRGLPDRSEERTAPRRPPTSSKRPRRERSDEWASIKQWALWPEQELYEAIRPIILYGQTSGERAKEIDVPQRTLARKANEFEQYGMRSLFSSEEQGGERETGKTLPEDVRQLIVDLHAEAPFMS